MKKTGTYWALIGTIAGKKGQPPRATIRTFLAFCGEEPNWERPGRTVDAVIEAHQRLQEIGLLDELPALEPPNRHKGFFRGWLDTPVSVRLSEDIWKISQAPIAPGCRRRASAASPAAKSAGQQPLLPLGIPDGPGQLQSDPASDPAVQDALQRAAGRTGERAGDHAGVAYPATSARCAPCPMRRRRTSSPSGGRRPAAESGHAAGAMPVRHDAGPRRPRCRSGPPSRHRARGAPPIGVAALAAPVTGASPRLAPSPV